MRQHSCRDPVSRFLEHPTQCEHFDWKSTEKSWRSGYSYRCQTQARFRDLKATWGLIAANWKGTLLRNANTQRVWRDGRTNWSCGFKEEPTRHDHRSTTERIRWSDRLSCDCDGCIPYVCNTVFILVTLFICPCKQKKLYRITKTTHPRHQDFALYKVCHTAKRRRSARLAERGPVVHSKLPRPFRE